MEDVLNQKGVLILQQIMETGSVRGAAEVLSIDPSMVSRAVAKLAQMMGTALLEKRGRSVVVTDAGRLLAQFAKRQQDLNDALLVELNNLKSAQQGHVEVAFGEGLIDFMVQPILQSFIRKHHGVTYSLQVVGTQECIRFILEDLTHIGLVFQPPNDARLRSHYSRPSPIRVHVRKDHPLARKRRAITMADLVPHQGITLMESFGVRQHIHAAELDEHVTLKPMVVTNSFKVLWQFPAMGLGYIMTPRSLPLLGDQFKELVSLPLANPILNNSRVHVLTRTGRALPPIAQSLLKHIVKTFPII